VFVVIEERKQYKEEEKDEEDKRNKDNGFRAKYKDALAVSHLWRH
jgi:hypothetical protein